MLKYFYSIILISVCCGSVATAQQEDTVNEISTAAAQVQHQLRFGVDIARPVLHAFYQNRNSYEFIADYYLKNEIYAVAEGGWGNADVNYDNLKYTSNNIFFKVGIDKSMFPRQHKNDWGMVFLGIRYGIGFVNRSQAFYKTDDGLGGITTGYIPAKTAAANWLEITGGLRMELVRNLFIGWNIRGRFLLNQKALGELQPAYIAGYGKGDKNTIFDFNFYLCYSIKW